MSPQHPPSLSLLAAKLDYDNKYMTSRYLEKCISPRRIIRLFIIIIKKKTKCQMQIFSRRAPLMGLIEWITAADRSMRIILQISPDCPRSCAPTNYNIASFSGAFIQREEKISFCGLPRPRCRLRTIGPRCRRLAAPCVCAHEWAYVYP